MARIFRQNLHTHTFRCKHAKGTPLDFAKAAAEHGLSVLGMTDHTPFPDDRVIMIRMAVAELDDYIREVREAQAAYPDLKILLGLECEYFPEFDDSRACGTALSWTGRPWTAIRTRISG